MNDWNVVFFFWDFYTKVGSVCKHFTPLWRVSACVDDWINILLLLWMFHCNLVLVHILPSAKRSMTMCDSYLYVVLLWSRRLKSNSNGEASSWSHHVPEAARHRDWSPVWEMRWQVCHLRLVRAPMYACPGLRWVQLWFIPGKVCDLRRSRHLRRLLLQGVYPAGEGPGWLSQDRQSWKCQDRSLLWAQEVWFQEEMIKKMELCVVLFGRVFCSIALNTDTESR